MEAGATWDTAIPPIPEGVRIFSFRASTTWMMLVIFLVLSAVSAGTVVYLFLTDDPSNRLILLPTAVSSAIFAGFTIRSWASSRNRVAVSDDGIWYLRRKGSATYMEWREVTQVRAHDVSQRLMLSDATGTRAIRLEYQLQDFESLRDFVLTRSAASRLVQPANAVFHRSSVYKIAMLLAGVLFSLPALRAHHQNATGSSLVWVALGLYWFARVMLDPVSVSLRGGEIVIEYLSWSRTIPLGSVTRILLSDVHVRGNIWVYVVIQRKGKKSIRLPQFREGSVAVYEGLLHAWQSAGGGVLEPSQIGQKDEDEEVSLEAHQPGLEPISSAGKSFRLFLIGISFVAASIALALILRGRLVGRALPNESNYPRHRGAIAARTELVGEGRIYLVQMGEHTAAYSLKEFGYWLRSKYGLDVRILPAMKIDDSAWDPLRRQYIAELLYQQLKQLHPELAADESAYLIGFTDADMYSIHHAWHSSFTQRDSMRSAVISTEGMDDSLLEKSTDRNGADGRFQARLRRILLKDVAVLYWHLNVNNDPTSLLHNTLDPDLPTEDIYESDLNPALTPDGERVYEPCVFFVYSATSGLKPLPGPPVRDCTSVQDPIEDESVELFEVDLRLGLLLDKRTDFYLPDVIPIEFQRVTRDGWPAAHPIGHSGTDNYDEFLCATDDALTGLQIVNAGGGREDFVRYPNWVPSKWLVKFVDGRGQFIALHRYPSEHFDLRDVGGGTRRYLSCPSSDVRCYFAGYQDALGRLVKVDRDDARSLIGVTSPNGNWIHVSHGPRGRISGIADSRGREVRYNYDEGNRLTAVVYPSGETFRYAYDGAQHLLSFSTAADAHSTPRVLLTNEYRNGILVKQTLADGSSYVYSYETNPSDQIDKALVRTPNGRSFSIDVTYSSSVIHEQASSAVNGSLAGHAPKMGK